MKRSAIVLSILLGLALLQAGGALARAEADAGTFSLEIDTVLPASCAGEPVRLTGTDDYHFATVFTPSGALHLTFGAQSSLSGVGLTSGARYAARGTFTDSLTFTPGGVQVITQITNFRLVGRGGTVIHVLRSVEIVVDGTTVTDVHRQFFC